MSETPKYFDKDGYVCETGVAPKFVLKEDYDRLTREVVLQSSSADWWRDKLYPEVARLTREREEAQEHVQAVDEANHHLKLLRDRLQATNEFLLTDCETLRAALATRTAAVRREAVEEAARVCEQPEPECCGQVVSASFDHPPECCGKWEPRDKTASECATAIRALLLTPAPALTEVGEDERIDDMWRKYTFGNAPGYGMTKQQFRNAMWSLAARGSEGRVGE